MSISGNYWMYIQNYGLPDKYFCQSLRSTLRLYANRVSKGFERLLYKYQAPKFSEFPFIWVKCFFKSIEYR